MNHKEEMEHLKIHDPILYCELTNNPTGSDHDYSFVGIIVFAIIIIAAAAFMVS